MQTIADRLGVSRMTVSNAFSRPDQLSAELREKVLATAKAMGYVGPDPVARALARGKAGTVGVLLTDSVSDAFTDEVATGFLAALTTELAPTGTALTLLTSVTEGDVIPARDLALDGAVVYSCRPDSEARRWLSRRRLPMVLVDQDPVEGVACVNVADRDGARAAAEHLLELGHRRIGIVTFGGEPDSGISSHPEHERMAGWTEALDAAGVTPDVEVVRDHGDAEAEEAAGRLLDRPDRPTGILCFSDLLALGVVRAAGARGLAVPRDLSVVGFDDSPAASRLDPPLTTVRQDVAAKGQAAAAALVAELDALEDGVGAEGGRTPWAPHLRLPTALVVRESTAPPPAAGGTDA